MAFVVCFGRAHFEGTSFKMYAKIFYSPYKRCLYRNTNLVAFISLEFKNSAFLMFISDIRIGIKLDLSDWHVCW